mgnify:CR=1 FL=1
MNQIRGWRRFMMRHIKNIAKAMGRFSRIVSTAEEDKKVKFRRSIVTTLDVSRGHTITSEDIAYKRPGTGIPPDESEFVIGRTVNKKILNDELLNWEDFE